MKRILLMMMVMMLSGWCFVATPTESAEYSLKRMTPAVEQALLNRRERFDALEEYKAKGIIGENNRGYVEVLVGDSQAADIVKGENQDRKIIYQTIAEQNGISGQIDVIEKVFAQVQHEKAKTGYKIQADNGAWTTK